MFVSIYIIYKEYVLNEDSISHEIEEDLNKGQTDFKFQVSVDGCNQIGNFSTKKTDRKKNNSSQNLLTMIVVIILIFIGFYLCGIPKFSASDNENHYNNYYYENKNHYYSNSNNNNDNNDNRFHNNNFQYSSSGGTTRKPSQTYSDRMKRLCNRLNNSDQCWEQFLLVEKILKLPVDWTLDVYTGFVKNWQKLKYVFTTF